MNNVKTLKRQLFYLQCLCGIQRSFRLFIRAIWLGIGVYLLAWGSHLLWDILPDQRVWLILGIAFAAIPLLGIVLTWPRRNQWIWRMDRLLGLQEQVSTSWQIVCSKSDGYHDSVGQALVDDVLPLLSKARGQIFLHGWSLGKELIALLIVGIMYACLYISSNMNSARLGLSESIQVMTLPALGEDLRSGDVFPSGIPGFDSPVNETQQIQNDNEQEDDNATPLSEAEYQALMQILKQTGTKLCQQASTYGLGQSLQKSDVGKAASDLQGLAAQYNALSGESKEKLAESLQQASDGVKQLGENLNQTLAESLGNAAQSIQDEIKNSGDGGEQNDSITPEDSSVGEQLDRVANDLRQISKDAETTGLSGGGIEGGSQTGGKNDGLPSPRLEGEGVEIDLIANQVEQSGLLSANPSVQSSEDPAGGTLSSASSGSEDIILSYIIPQAYSWQMLNVVETYFRR